MDPTYTPPLRHRMARQAAAPRTDGDYPSPKEAEIKTISPPTTEEDVSSPDTEEIANPLRENNRDECAAAEVNEEQQKDPSDKQKDEDHDDPADAAFWANIKAGLERRRRQREKRANIERDCEQLEAMKLQEQCEAWGSRSCTRNPKAIVPVISMLVQKSPRTICCA